MTNEISERKILVMLPENLVGALLEVSAYLNASLAGSLQDAIEISANNTGGGSQKPIVKARPVQQAGKYSAEFLGQILSAWTLPEIFARIVDLTAYVAPEALDVLASKRANKRRYVSRSSETIHPGRPDLAVMRTTSGWWISKNIGQDDLKRALRTLSQAAGLNFGRDVKFPSRS